MDNKTGWAADSQEPPLAMITRLKEQLMRLITLPMINAIADTLLPKSLPIFVLHRSAESNHPISGIDPEYLRRCLRYLKSRRYHFATADEIVATINGEHCLPSRSVGFCLDDGYLDQAQVLCKVLIEEQCPATFFVIADLIDGTDWPWDDKVAHMTHHSQRASLTTTVAGKELHLHFKNHSQRKQSRHELIDACKQLNPDLLAQTLTTLAVELGVTPPATPPPEFTPMNWHNVSELSQQGITIGPHSCSHRILSQLNDQESEQEILQSWNRLSEKIPEASNIFCYPTGRREDFGEREEKLLKKHHFIGGFSSITKPVIVNIDDNPFAVPRMQLPKNFSTFIRYCSWIEVLREKINN